MGKRGAGPPTGQTPARPQRTRPTDPGRIPSPAADGGPSPIGDPVTVIVCHRCAGPFIATAAILAIGLVGLAFLVAFTLIIAIGTPR